MNVKMRKSTVKFKVKEYYTATLPLPPPGPPPPPPPPSIDKDFHNLYHLPLFFSMRLTHPLSIMILRYV